MRVWDSALLRVGLRTTGSRDLLLGVVCAIASIVVLVPLLGPIAQDLGIRLGSAQAGAVVAICVIQSLLLALRRSCPVACVLLVAMCQLALVAVLPADVTVRLAAPIIASYTAGFMLAWQKWSRVVGIAALLEVAGAPIIGSFLAPAVRSALGAPAADVVPRLESWSTVAGWLVSDLLVVLLYLSAALLGASWAARLAYLGLLEGRADAVAREQKALLAAAIGSERTRMARELHDIAAHHLSGLVVQASAAERLLDLDKSATRDAIRSIRAQGKETLENLRMVVGILRDEGRPVLEGLPEGAPIPGLADLEGLLESARALGDQVEATIEGTPYPLPPIADITAYRVAQEALANARQHAPGQPVRISLGYRAESVRLEVHNSLEVYRENDSDRRGFGLIGMRERAGLALGKLDAGRVSEQWRVRLDLPRPRHFDGGGS